MMTYTLTGLLEYQAAKRGKQVAIRHKQLGVWQESTWQDVHREVLALASALQRYHFGEGDQLVMLSHPRPQALLLALAAQQLGGVAAPLDLLADQQQIQALLHQLNPAFVFAEGQDEVDLLDRAGLQPALVLYADARGLAGRVRQGLVDYATLTSIGPNLDSAASAEETSRKLNHQDATDVAFIFYRLDAAGHSQQQSVSHHDLLSEGRVLVAREHLTHKEEALAARAFAASGHVRYLLAPWLQAGFRLNFPENLVTRDNDRRELGPTLVAGTRSTYQRLESLVLERLPQTGTWRRKWIDYALNSGDAKQGSSWSVQRLLTYWLVIRPLRDVIGFSCTRVPLLVGEPLPASSERFFLALGIEVRNWIEPAHWQALNQDALKHGRLGVVNHLVHSSNQEVNASFKVAGVNV